MVAYMEESVDDDGLLDTTLLPGPLQKSYKELREGKRLVRRWSKELQEALRVEACASSDDNMSM